MNSIHKFFGQKLKDIRVYRGLTLAEVSNETGISKQTLSQYENNKIRPDFDNIVKLSEFLSVPSSFFFNEIVNRVELGSTYFRSLASSSKKSRLESIKKVEYLSQIFQYLNRMVNFPKFDSHILNFVGNLNSINEEDEVEYLDLLAERIRNYWNLEERPIEDFKYLLESKGIIVTSIESNEKIAAFSQKIENNNGDDRYIFVINDNQSTSRVLFDLAHELGHVLLHPWSEDVESLDRDEYNLRERQANRFASSFLLPKKSFSEDIKYNSTDLNYYLMLKSKWKVSAQAMIYRAKELNLISYNQVTYLNKQINYKGYRKCEPNDTNFVISENLMTASMKLLIESEIFTLNDFISQTGVNFHSEELERLLKLPKGYLEKDINRNDLYDLVSVAKMN